MSSLNHWTRAATAVCVFSIFLISSWIFSLPAQATSIVDRELVDRSAFAASAGVSTCNALSLGPIDSRTFDLNASEPMLWSDPNTWPSGRVPGPGDLVTIESQMHVVVDQHVDNLDGLHVHGVLEVARQTTHISTRFILVTGEGALFRVGTEEEPFENELIITLIGNDRTRNEAGEGFFSMGTKFIGTMMGGSLGLYGAAPEVTWTQLAATATAGSNTILLTDTPDWSVGDQIAIAPSGINPEETAMRTITSISGNAVVLDRALAHTHVGEIYTYDTPLGSKSIDHRAEVAVLTRNVIVRGDDGSEEFLDGPYRTGFGGHIMIMGDGYAHVQGLQLIDMGQTGIKGRYPIHWHAAGPRSGDYARKNAIHSSFQRGVALHRTQFVEVSENVAYDILDHVYVFSEDGNEFGNRFEYNLAILNRSKRPQHFAFPSPRKPDRLSAQGEQRPGLFWGRNPHQVFIGNRAAGSMGGHGFFVDQILMDNAFRNDVIRNQPVFFEDNAAHTVYSPSFGKDMYGPETQGSCLMVQTKGGPYELLFRDFEAYGCSRSGAWIEAEDVTLSDARISDSGVGVSNFRAFVDTLVVVGRSPNPALEEDVQREPLSVSAYGHQMGGVHYTDKIAQSPAGEYRRSVYVKNAHFIDTYPAGITIEPPQLYNSSEIENITAEGVSPLFYHTTLPIRNEPVRNSGIFRADLGTTLYNKVDPAASACTYLGALSARECQSAPQLSPGWITANELPGLKRSVWDGKADNLFHSLDPEALAADLTAQFRSPDQTNVSGLTGSNQPSGQFVARYEGLFTVPENGTYRFDLNGKDGSVLYINKDLVVFGDRQGSAWDWSGELYLQEGTHTFDLFWRARSSDPSMSFRLDGQPILFTRGDLIARDEPGGGPLPDENQLPTVEIVAPRDGIAIPVGTTGNIRVVADDSDGFVTQVRFFVNDVPQFTDEGAPYTWRTTADQAGTFMLTAEARDNDGATVLSAPVTLTVGNAGAPRTAQGSGGNARTGNGNLNATSQALPERLNIEAAFPNPFTESTTLHLALPERSDYQLEVFNVLGQRVQLIELTNQSAGYQSIVLDLYDASAGLYLVELRPRSEPVADSYTPQGTNGFQMTATTYQLMRVK